MGKRKGRGPAVTPPSGEDGSGSKPPPEWTSEEDLCFVCKDGGLLRLCERRNCHKAYHPECVGKDDDFLNSDEKFFCGWHTCFICKGSSYYQCFCCPGMSVCRGCLTQADFVQVRSQTKGFCTDCLRLAIMIEKEVEVDSDGEKVDFDDRETYEFLFKEYWEIVRGKEGLTLDNLQEADAYLKNQVSDSENLPEEEHNSDDNFLGDSDDEPIRLSNVKGTSNRVKTSLKQGKSKKNVYVGWGSKELIGFLASIGKDTTKSLDQFGAAEAVREYIRQKDLLQKDKKKLVICDDKLCSLFSKSKFKYNKIYSLLEKHISANAISDDETSASSEDNSDSPVKKKTHTMISESCTPKRISERDKRCFAALVRDNIKLIYLKRSLVMDLLKQPETFENKIIGCFVRVKNDPKDYSYNKHKKLYQLGQVTGIRKSSEEYKIRDTSTDMLLCISSSSAEVKISMLSDEDFEEEECEDLRLLAQKEHCKRHTVIRRSSTQTQLAKRQSGAAVRCLHRASFSEGSCAPPAELEEKVRSVQRDIVSHWINKELQRLEKLIDLANEKGWRYEMRKYIDKRQLLRTPSERQRLLEEVPRVIPDSEDNEDTELLVAASDKPLQKNTSVLQGANGEKTVCLESCSEENFRGAKREKDVCLRHCSKQKPKGANEDNAVCLKICSEEKAKDTKAHAVGDTITPRTDVQNQGSEVNVAGGKDNVDGGKPGMHVQKQGNEGNVAGITAQVIIIDDDEGANITVDQNADESWYAHVMQHKVKDTTMWHYTDPDGDAQGPFPIERLRSWKKAGYFDDDFRVWRAGESCDKAILLTDALRLKG